MDDLNKVMDEVLAMERKDLEREDQQESNTNTVEIDVEKINSVANKLDIEETEIAARQIYNTAQLCFALQALMKGDATVEFTEGEETAVIKGAEYKTVIAEISLSKCWVPYRQSKAPLPEEQDFHRCACEGLWIGRSAYSLLEKIRRYLQIAQTDWTVLQKHCDE